MIDAAKQAEKVRDLRSQLSGVDTFSQEFVFQHIRTGRDIVIIYDVVDGSPVPVQENMLGSVMTTTLPDGRFRFVSDPKDAPEFKLGSVKCFLHPDSPERPILAELGLSSAMCSAAHLANAHSKRIHGQHRHKQEWAALEDYLTSEKEQKAEQRQESQLQATLALAGKAAGAADAPSAVCDICGKEGLKNVGAHKRGAHKQNSS